VPQDPFALERGDEDLIDEDVLEPISYMYHDREDEDKRLDPGKSDWRGVPGIYAGGGLPYGIDKPLSRDAYILVGVGPDLLRQDDAMPYSPTNGTKSYGDTTYRSDGGS
jgi:hypothetical protein